MSETYTIEARSLEWVYLLTKIISAHKPKVGDVQMASESGNPIYFIKKSLIPVDKLAKVLGTTAEQLGAAKKRIILRPLSDDTTLPKPTVNYLGEA